MKRPYTKLIVAVLVAASALTAIASPATIDSIQIEPIGTIAAGSFDESAAEIAAYDPRTRRLFVVNAQVPRIDVVSISDPSNPTLVGVIEITPYGATANSVAFHRGTIAVAVEAETKTDPGKVVFFDGNLTYTGELTVGAQPDMLTFTPDGNYLLVANEAEPADDYSIDPVGSVSVILIKHKAGRVFRTRVMTAGFEAFNGFTREELFYGDGSTAKPAIRVYGPESTVAQNLEPEYITVSNDSKTAWVTLQEANAIAIIDIRSATVTRIVGLGTKDHSLSENSLDASNRDDAINIRTWPVEGFYQPDAIASYKARGKMYLVIANEGDSRDWEGYSEEERIGDLNLDPSVFPPATASELQENENLGRLKTTSAYGDPDGDGLHSELYSYGGRSFSILDSDGRLVWDSGDSFERITAAANPDFFNSSNDENEFDDRSDDKGPEPEGVTVGTAFGRQYAFIGLERVGGLMVYDVTVPQAPEFVQYINNRDFSVDAEFQESLDLGPEGILFIPAKESPNGSPLVVVSNEVSGTTTVYQVNRIKTSEPTSTSTRSKSKRR